MTTGWRARIGGLLPASNGLDAELWRFLPDGVSLHLTRFLTPRSDATLEERIADATGPSLEAAARLLAPLRLDSLAYLCASSSFCGGPGHDQRIVARLQGIVGVPATTPATATVVALRALGLRRVTVVSPHAAAITEQLVRFLEGNGFEICSWHAMELTSDAQFQAMEPAALYQLVRQLDQPQAEAIVIGCTALQTVEILDALEQDLGKPVLSATQVTLWHALRLAGVRERMSGLGSLYSRLAVV